METSKIIENISFTQKKEIFQNNLIAYLDDLFPGYELSVTITNNPNQELASVMISPKNYKNQITRQDNETIEKIIKREATANNILLGAIVIE